VTTFSVTPVSPNDITGFNSIADNANTEYTVNMYPGSPNLPVCKYLQLVYVQVSDLPVCKYLQLVSVKVPDLPVCKYLQLVYVKV